LRTGSRTIELVLNERKAKTFAYDPATDVARLAVTDAPGTVRTRTVEGSLLLDANGFLVGVDVDPHSADRVVVMLGPHEAVARTTSARVSVTTDASATVYEVRIRGARDAIRGRDPNPYV
jgi:hypothetical protein